MNYNIIESGSKGNCIIVEDLLMLDCGCSYTKIKKYLKDVKLIFISHVHKDHLLPATIKMVAYNFPNIKFVCGSEYVVTRLVLDCNVSEKNIYVLKKDTWFDLGLLKVKMQELAHDTPNYLLKFEIKAKKGIYIVDTENVKEIKAKDYDLFLIESNYKEEILQNHIMNCENDDELFYLKRVPNTHLSFEQANGFLIENMKQESQFEYIHKSSYNFEEEK